MKSTGTNNIERKGKELKKEDIKKLAKDPADIMSDFEGELLDQLREDYKRDKKPGESFLEFLNRMDDDYFLKRPLGLMYNVARVIDFITDYKKSLRKP